jgi:hypothetical protein
VVPGHLFEHTDELLADAPALLLRIDDAFEPGQEPVRRLHVHQGHLEVSGERLLHILRLPCAEQSRVHEYARQPVADGSVDQQRRHGGIDPTGEGAEHLPVPDLLANAFDRAVDHVHRSPIREQAAAVVQEPFQYLHAVRCMGHLGMELHGEEPALRLLHRSHRRGLGARRHPKSFGGPNDRIGVAHPHRLVSRQVSE